MGLNFADDQEAKHFREATKDLLMRRNRKSGRSVLYPLFKPESTLDLQLLLCIEQHVNIIHINALMLLLNIV